jgi:hypothetical protein
MTCENCDKPGEVGIWKQWKGRKRETSHFWLIFTYKDFSRKRPVISKDFFNYKKTSLAPTMEKAWEKEVGP